MQYISIFFFAFICGCTPKKHEVALDKADVYYSCSMHPEVRKSKPGNCPICPMPLTVVQESKLQTDELQLSDQQIQLGNIRLDTIKSGNMGSQNVLTAVINFDQAKTSAISSRVMGRVERLYFKNIGDYIRKGDKLYDLYSEDLNNGKEEYLLALQNQKSFTGANAINFNSLLLSGRNKLALWGMSPAQIDQLGQSGKASPITTFYSIASGYITALNVRQGEYVMDGGTIVQLADLSTVWAEAQVFSSQFSALRQYDSVTVRIPALGNETIKAAISFVSPEIVADSRINLVRVSIPNNKKLLKPGMEAYVYLNASNSSVLSLPVEAVIRDSKGATVWKSTGTNTFRNAMVTVGSEANGRIEIKTGLMPGDVVVITGAYLLNSEYIFKKGTNPMEGMKM